MRHLIFVFFIMFGWSQYSSANSRILFPASAEGQRQYATMGFGAGLFQRSYRFERGPFDMNVFMGRWNLVLSQGESCAPIIEVSSPANSGMRIYPTDRLSVRPKIDIPSINRGEQSYFQFSSGWVWSYAVGESGRIYHTSTVTGYMFYVHTRLEREVEVMEDGSLVLTISDRATSRPENFRCVYIR